MGVRNDRVSKHVMIFIIVWGMLDQERIEDF